MICFLNPVVFYWLSWDTFIRCSCYVRSFGAEVQRGIGYLAPAVLLKLDFHCLNHLLSRKDGGP